MNCCSDFPWMNDPYLELREQPDFFFPGSLYENKFHIFQNISSFLIHGLRTFKCRNMCELCDKIQYKDKTGIVIVNKLFVFHEDFIYGYHKKITLPQKKNCRFIFFVSRLLV